MKLKRQTIVTSSHLVCLHFKVQKTAGNVAFSKIVLFGVIGNYTRTWRFKLFPLRSFIKEILLNSQNVTGCNEQTNQTLVD